MMDKIVCRKPKRH